MVSRATVRQLQVGLKLHKPKKRRLKRVFQLRDRRPRFGELVQIDGSPHDWFEGRAPRCTLIVFVDDATSRLLTLHFAPAECAKAYLDALRDQVLTHGRPLAFYSDCHGIFRVNAKDAQSGDGKTEFGRMADRLDIGLINALTPQAKSRVERVNQTLQDRLIKEMRLCNIDSIEAAAAFLPGLILKHNEKFGVPPADETPAHRPWTKTADELDETLARREERILSKALTFSSGGIKYCVKTAGPGGPRYVVPRSCCITSPMAGCESIIRSGCSASQPMEPIRLPTRPRTRRPWTCASKRSSRRDKSAPPWPWPRPA